MIEQFNSLFDHEIEIGTNNLLIKRQVWEVILEPTTPTPRTYQKMWSVLLCIVFAAIFIPFLISRRKVYSFKGKHVMVHIMYRTGGVYYFMWVCGVRLQVEVVALAIPLQPRQLGKGHSRFHSLPGIKYSCI